MSVASRQENNIQREKYNSPRPGVNVIDPERITTFLRGVKYVVFSVLSLRLELLRVLRFYL